MGGAKIFSQTQTRHPSQGWACSLTMATISSALAGIMGAICSLHERALTARTVRGCSLAMATVSSALAGIVGAVCSVPIGAVCSVSIGAVCSVPIIIVGAVCSVPGMILNNLEVRCFANPRLNSRLRAKLVVQQCSEDAQVAVPVHPSKKCG